MSKWIAMLVAGMMGWAGTSMANEDDPHFLNDVAELMVRCSVLPVAYSLQGRKVSGNLRSICPDEVQAYDNAARFVLNGEVYYAALYESRYSDGGDLNDLQVTRADGTVVAFKESILAYGDVLLALAYPRDDFREEFEPSLIAE
jgi:hypothetical protein